MTDIKLAVERAHWAVRFKETMSRDFILVEDQQANDTVFTLIHKDSPGWEATVAVCSHSRRNKLTLNQQAIPAISLEALRERIEKLRQEFGLQTVKDAERERAAQGWQERQDSEMTGMAWIDGVTADIIQLGPHAGKYCLSFEPGHPLEHVTLKQLKTFHAFLRTLSG